MNQKYIPYGTRLKDGMVFNLSVGLQDVPLSVSERKGSGAADMETFSVMIAGGWVDWGLVYCCKALCRSVGVSVDQYACLHTPYHIYIYPLQRYNTMVNIHQQPWVAFVW